MRLEYQILIAVALDLAPGRSPLAAAPGPRHRPAGRVELETLARRLLGSTRIAGLVAALAVYVTAGLAAWGAIRLAAARGIRWPPMWFPSS